MTMLVTFQVKNKNDADRLINLVMDEDIDIISEPVTISEPVIQPVTRRKINLNPIPDEDNIKQCDHCGELTTHTRFHEAMPPEGEKCVLCGNWVCPSCIDWNASGDTGCVCIGCTPRLKIYVGE